MRCAAERASARTCLNSTGLSGADAPPWMNERGRPHDDAQGTAGAQSGRVPHRERTHVGVARAARGTPEHRIVHLLLRMLPHRLPGDPAADLGRVRGRPGSLAPLRDRAGARIPKVERVVDDHGRYAVVDKFEEVAPVVEGTDPRRGDTKEAPA